MKNDTVIEHPIFSWTLREDGIITLIVVDATNQTTRILLTEINVSTLLSAMEMAEQALQLFEEYGFEGAEKIINAHAETQIISDEEFNSLLDEEE